MLAYISGRFLPDDQASVSINDRGWLYGDAVFETLRTFNRRPFQMERHLERLHRSASLIGLALPLDRLGFAVAVEDLLAREESVEDVMIRITVSRGTGGGLGSPHNPKPTVVIQQRPLPAYLPEVFTRGYSVIIAKTRRNAVTAISPLVKSANFLNNILAKDEATAAGADDAVMLSQSGFVAEGTTSNLFVVVGTKVLTPPVEDGVLPGITREIVINLARRLGIGAAEESFRPEDLYQAREAWLTLTSAGMIPIVMVDGRRIGSGRPGPVYHQLKDAYEELTDRFSERGSDYG